MDSERPRNEGLWARKQTREECDDKKKVVGMAKSLTTSPFRHCSVLAVHQVWCKEDTFSCEAYQVKSL